MFKVVENIRTRYRWALISIALLISLSASLMQYFFSEQRFDAKIINIAGKQRMLSQKIAWHSGAILSSPNKLPEHVHSLKASINLFESAHKSLLSKNEGGNYIYLTPELINLYESEPNSLDSQIKLFIKEANNLLYQQGEVNTQIFSVEYVEELLKRLDLAVSLFEKQAVEKVNWVSNFELLFWLIAMILLLVELRFVFIPMEQKIHHTLKKYHKQKEFSKQVSKNKEHFIARASHEFRTPLQGLVVSIEELNISKNQQNIKNQAMYCALRLVAMLDELQDLQALSLGQWALKSKKDNLLKSLEKVLIAYEYGYTQKGIKLVTALDSTLNCTVKIDHQRLQQVLTELLGNALKFTEQGGVNVTAKLRNDQLIITVEDTGIGFSNPVRTSGFDSLNQNNHFQGLRTGLARVQYIVKAFNGDIQFESNKPKGALVTLQIPIVTKQLEVSKNALLPSTLHCLVVEDNPLNMLVLTRVLASLGFSYECAENGKVACEMVTKKQYGVIFMDLNMPVMDGFEASKAIHIFDGAIPIVVVTANTSENDITYANECGAQDHIFKPIDQQAIIDVLTRVFNREVADS